MAIRWLSASYLPCAARSDFPISYSCEKARRNSGGPFFLGNMQQSGGCVGTAACVDRVDACAVGGEHDVGAGERDVLQEVHEV